MEKTKKIIMKYLLITTIFFLLFSCSKEIPDSQIQYAYEKSIVIWVVGDANLINIDSKHSEMVYPFRRHGINFNLIEIKHIEDFNITIAKQISLSNGYYNVFVLNKSGNNKSGGSSPGNWFWIRENAFSNNEWAYWMGKNLGLEDSENENNIMCKECNRLSFTEIQGQQMKTYLGVGGTVSF